MGGVKWGDMVLEGRRFRREGFGRREGVDGVFEHADLYWTGLETVVVYPEEFTLKWRKRDAS